MCLKKMLAIFLNGLLVMTGVALIVGAAVVHLIILKKLSNDKVHLGWVVTVLGIAGALAILAAILGLCGIICCENWFPILLAVVLIGVVVLMDMAFLIKIDTTVNEFHDYLKRDASAHMKEYGKDIEATAEWNMYQEFGQCCGLNSAADWEALGTAIPLTCCKADVNACDTTVPENRHKNGCYSTIQNKIDSSVKMLKIVIICVMLIQLMVGAFDAVLLVKMVGCALSKCCKKQEIERA